MWVGWLGVLGVLGEVCEVSRQQQSVCEHVRAVAQPLLVRKRCCRQEHTLKVTMPLNYPCPPVCSCCIGASTTAAKTLAGCCCCC